jgi:hypothetical protein
MHPLHSLSLFVIVDTRRGPRNAHATLTQCSPTLPHTHDARSYDIPYDITNAESLRQIDVDGSGTLEWSEFIAAATESIGAKVTAAAAAKVARKQHKRGRPARRRM